MRFEFATASRIIFGPGTLSEAAPLAAEMGRRALLVTGKSIDRSLPLRTGLAQHGIRTFLFRIFDEPTLDRIAEGLRTARVHECDLVIAMGGGSVMDAGKAVAALMSNPGDPMDYLEVVGKGRPLRNVPAPCIAIPTTAGTGAEVTRNSVLTSPEHRVKVSMRSPMMLPDLALIDPELTYSLPPAITASTGMDALTQVLESYVSTSANPMTDAFCRDGLKRAARSLPRAFKDGNDREAREDMSLVSLYGGLALANAKLGAVHGFAGPLGATISAPHGVICACLLPIVMDANIRPLQQHSGGPYLKRYVDIARLLTGDPEATAQDGVAWVRGLCTALGIPNLTGYGLTEHHFPEVTAAATASSSMKGNPVQLSHSALVQILEASLR